MKTLLTRQSVLVIIGGHAQRLLPILKKLYPKASYVLFIDAPNELDRISEARNKPRMRLFSLGVGHTAQTLCEGLPQNVVDHIRSNGGMSASGGMGQSILVGRQAGKRLVESPDFQQFVTQVLIPEIRNLAGGALEEVRLIFIGSIAGATYTGVELPVAEYLASALRQRTSAIISSEFLATGSLTYEGLGDRIWSNGAAALTELLAYVSDPNRNARDVRSLRLIEFAMCGKDEALRDALLAQLEQAAHCESLEYERERDAPNFALNGKFGNIQTWESSYGTELDLVNDIRPVIAEAYVPLLKGVLKREASVSFAEHLELAHTRTKLANSPVEDILETAVELPATRSLTALKCPSFSHTVRVLAKTSTGSLLALEGLPELWAKAALTIEEIDNRLQLQRRVLHLLDEELRELGIQREDNDADITEAEEEFSRQHALLTPDGLLGFVRGAFQSTSRKLHRLTRAANKLRDSVDEQCRLRAEEIAISRVNAAILSEFTFLNERLQKLSELLTGDGTEIGSTIPTIVPHPLNERLADLWDAIDGEEEDFADAIRGSVQHVTLTGIAKVTGAKAARAEVIAKRITSGLCYSTPAPPWGGRIRSDQGRDVHVLPPATLETQKIIAAAVKDLNPKITVAFADAAPAFVNIVGITIRLVRRLSDVLTEPYLNGLIETLNSTCSEMFHPEGKAFLESLGLEIRENKIVFKDNT